jgi:hypothetical protein
LVHSDLNFLFLGTSRTSFQSRIFFSLGTSRTSFQSRIFLFPRDWLDVLPVPNFSLFSALAGLPSSTEFSFIRDGCDVLSVPNFLSFGTAVTSYPSRIFSHSGRLGFSSNDVASLLLLLGYSTSFFNLCMFCIFIIFHKFLFYFPDVAPLL